MSLSPNQKLKCCKRIREYANKSLYKVLKKILNNNLKSSESEIRDMWLSELRKNDSILSDGWYSPPPHGIAILIGKDNEGKENRLNYKSLRSEQKWPRKDIYLDTQNGILFAYASPIDKKSGIIGDFGITIYFGKNKEIIDHLILCQKIVNQVFQYIKPGQTFSQIAKHMKNIITTYGLNNEIECKTSPSLSDYVGHTIPYVVENLNDDEMKVLKRGSHENIKTMISEKRIFVRASENQEVKKGMAFTIEPRPQVINNPKIPMVLFHSICVIYENGEKELITNFDNLFNLVGMDYMK